MAKTKEKKKTSPIFLGIVILLMLIAFVMQMVFPASLGETWGTLTESAAKITVTTTAGETYVTSSTEEILAFGKWADGVSMRNKSLASRFSADKPMNYSFAIETLSGTYIDLIIDEKGFVQTGVEVYMVTGDPAEFLEELETQLRLWSGTERAE